jgi:hypothetical protein
MKSLFSKLGIEAQSRLGLRWTKTAAQKGTSAARIAAMRAGERGGELAARVGAEKAAAIAAKQGARMAATSRTRPHRCSV